MIIENVKIADIENWLLLVREVEPLFGPMVDDPGFHEAIKSIIESEQAFCLRNNQSKICGVIVISYEKNEIEWFAVANHERRNGYGELLLAHALNQMNSQKEIVVQTFAASVLAGRSARNLYMKCGFQECEEAGLNPAGIPTVILKRKPCYWDKDNQIYKKKKI